MLTCFLMMTMISCKTDHSENTMKETKRTFENPVVYFEIPVYDIDRAIKFYGSVFHFDFDKQIIDHNEMALFPFKNGQFGITGALAKGKTYKPTKDGVIIYFNTLDIENTLENIVENGGTILYPITSIGELGSVAEFEDSEGNRIALHQKNN
ncbi:VOC family protein [Flagellimonas meridianipacifica]|uniref:VOC domain-containing protein n=1 Tax=Flagellimonas meridianipacifica TaxID=1080225 RepID=A0A2T0M9H4_9FLAO|nr:VOC family protein [Allomuricauda pacifica]PRX54187.1 hypothetical protein CLV81_2584 [Allomuricauda pacifica]